MLATYFYHLYLWYLQLTKTECFCFWGEALPTSTALRHSHSGGEGSNETAENKITRLDQELVDSEIKIPSLWKQVSKFSNVTGVIEKEIRVFSDRNIDRNVKIFIEHDKTKNSGGT